MTSRQTLIRLLAAAAALAYSSWVLAPLVGSPLDPIRSYVSELAATDQPASWLYRGADLVAAALLVALGWTLARERAGGRAGGGPGAARPGPWWRDHRVGGWLLAAMGVATAADGNLPLHCAATHDEGCAAAERAGTLPLTHLLHAGSSVLASLAMLLAVVVLTRALAPTAQWAGRALVLLALAVALTSLLTIVEFGVVGLLQRAQLATFAAWLTLAGALAGSRR